LDALRVATAPPTVGQFLVLTCLVGALLGFGAAGLPLPPAPPPGPEASLSAASSGATPTFQVVLNTSPSEPTTDTNVTFSAAAGDGLAPYEFAWTFGDGSIGAGVNVTHRFAASGVYNITVLVTDAANETANASERLVVFAAPPPALSVTLAASPSNGTAPLSVSFAANVSGGSPPYAVAWRFGDGSSGSGRSADHVYTTAGRFLVEILANDSANRSANASTWITVVAPSPPPLLVSVNVSESAGPEPLNGTLRANVTGGVAPYAAVWKFPNDTTDAGLSVPFSFAQTGAATVTVTVTDAVNQSVSTNVTITVEAPVLPPLEVSATSSTVPGSAPLNYTFSSTVTGASGATSVLWSFGDGTEANGATVGHVFSAPGPYTVVVEVRDGANRTATGTTVVDVPAAVWNLAVERVSPSKRSDYSMTYATPTKGNPYVILFGGRKGGSVYDDTWVFLHGAWYEPKLRTHPPPTRYGMITWDPVDQEVVLFGGSNETAYMNDTWTFTPKTGWQQLHPSIAPAPRRSGGMVFDAADGYVLLWGGHNSSDELDHYQPDYTMLNDTWKFLHGTWTRLVTAQAPHGVSEPTLDYDPALGKVVEFGGYYQTGAVKGGYRALNQTWVYSAGVWTNLSLSHSPYARDGAASAYDPALGGLVISGGQDEGVANECLMTDTWVLTGSSPQTAAWTQLSTAGAVPPMDSAYAVYDADLAEIVMFGGTGNTRGICGGIPTMDWFSTTWLLAPATAAG
jgi:PKD repeat protein